MIALLVALTLLCAPPPVVVFGDSIAVGYGARTRAAMWTEQLGVATDNRAVAGSTVAGQVEKQITVYEGGAGAAIWMSCTNDLFAQTPPASYRQALQDGVQRLQARGMTVYLGTCLSLKDRPEAPPNWRILHDAYSQAAREVAQATGAILVDVDAVYDPETTEAAFLPWHPDDTGHQAIGRAFAGALGRRVWLSLVARSLPITPKTTQQGQAHAQTIQNEHSLRCARHLRTSPPGVGAFDRRATHEHRGDC